MLLRLNIMKVVMSGIVATVLLISSFFLLSTPPLSSAQYIFLSLGLFTSILLINYVYILYPKKTLLVGLGSTVVLIGTLFSILLIQEIPKVPNDKSILYLCLLPIAFSILTVLVLNQKTSFELSTTPQTDRKIYSILFWIIVVSFACCFFYISRTYIGNDEGSYLYEAVLVLQGKVPLQDFISRAPTEIYFFALLFKMFGYSVTIAKIINTLIVTSIGMLVYKLVRKYQSQPVSLMAMILTYINTSFFITRMVIDTAGFSILMILLSCYFITRKDWISHIVAGLCIATAVFTREINAFFAVAIVIYLLATKQWFKSIYVSAGGVILSVTILSYFSAHIGLISSISMLLGVGHVGIQEAKIATGYSMTIYKYFLLSIIPAFILFFALKKDSSRYKELYPEIIWIGATALFYVYYVTKRGFMLSYGSEFVPLIMVCVFSIGIFSTKAYVKKYTQYLLIPLIVFLCCWPYTFLYKNSELLNIFTFSRGFSIDRLIGSGIPLKNYQMIEQVIQGNTNSHDVILTGNLAFLAENKLQQFLYLTRPMAYTANSTVYELYHAPSPDEIESAFAAHPPKLVIRDRHLNISLWDDIGDAVTAKYSLLYYDDFATIYKLKDTETLQTLSLKKID